LNSSHKEYLVSVETITHDDTLPTIVDDGSGLEAITHDMLAQQLKTSGFTVLRHFDVDLHAFSAFVKKHSKRLSLDPARVFHDAQGKPVAQKVDAGIDAVGLHCENGNSPFWPDVCWFYCETAARQGSQTTVCDGVGVFNELSAGTRQRLLAHDIVYSRRVPGHLWKTYVQHGSGDGEASGDTEALFHKLLSLINEAGSAEVTLHEDESIAYRFRTPAVLRHSAFNPSFQAFANSIFGPSYNYERPSITFDDGTALDDALLDELRRICDKHTRNIDWETNDIVVIDNRRVMHGRRAIEDTCRTIYNALSYV
jgi:alpha-ketoglutarate-dependent taurine dioxygenase